MEDTVERSPSRIPTPVSRFRRTASVRVRGERPVILYSTSPTPFPSINEREEVKNLPKVQWSSPNRFNLGLRSQSQASGLNRKDDDLDSLESYGSNFSCASKLSTRSSCEHSPFAKNGTTFSARNNKFIVHCGGNCHTPEEYLTPTQRANKNIRRLKTLLQLAKDKLMEKEKEIFKLTKEVVELKVFKASIKNGRYSEASTPSDVKEDLPEEGSAEGVTYTVDGCDTYADLTPIQTTYAYEEKTEDTVDKPSPRGKMSPTSPLHLRDKMSATPEYLLSSLADSGNFDDLASSLSLQSKESLNLQAMMEEDRPVDINNDDSEDEKSRLVCMYEALLLKRKDTYEQELRSVKLSHEEASLKMVDNFEIKLKEEEKRFEERFNDLLKTTEQDKIDIVERFEKKLDEEKKGYFAKINSQNGDINNCESYLLRVDEEKALYEKSLSDIKRKFEMEQELIEKSFDDALAAERCKFESSVEEIHQESDRQVRVLNEKIADYESRYNELLKKYNDSLTKISQLEEENKLLKTSLDEQLTREKEMYLKMYMKGQEARQFLPNGEGTSGDPQPIVPMPELLVQLKVTKAELENLKAMYKRLAEAQQRPASRPRSTTGQDPEATLQFLKSAVYYFLTDRDNHVEHLRAIENILGFSAAERQNIHTSYVY